MMFDAHIHNKHHESGGILIGIESGKAKSFGGTLNNEEVLRLHDPRHNYFSFFYVTADGIRSKLSWPLLKFHPRREGYSPDQVVACIKGNGPKGVIIDTLNEPYWRAYDYWEVARSVGNTTVIMAHAGGYLINDFIKMCHFQENVWLDFSFTCSVLGKLGDRKYGLPYVNEAILYALNGTFKNRILMASDFPFCDQDEVFAYYSGYHEQLNENFLYVSRGWT